MTVQDNVTKKEISVQVFSCSFCEMFQTSFSAEHLWATAPATAQKRKFSIEDFFSKYDQIRRKLWIWSHLLRKSLMGNPILSAVCFMPHGCK